jgi:uncharacterized small protein (DUF1192 family)
MVHDWIATSRTVSRENWGAEMAASDMEMFEAQEHIAALEAENERLRATLAAKETVQRANEDEMSADNERLRDALLGIVGLPDVHAKELEIAVDALAALEVGE